MIDIDDDVEVARVSQSVVADVAACHEAVVFVEKNEGCAGSVRSESASVRFVGSIRIANLLRPKIVGSGIGSLARRLLRETFESFGGVQK